MDIDETFDIFIAFHGGRDTGTLKKAEEIYDFLIQNGYKSFIQTKTNLNGAYKDTHRIAQNSKLFLFVVNSSIKRNDYLMDTKNEKGETLRIWQEINAFRESRSNSLYSDISSRLYLCDDILEKEYDNYTKIDSMFNGKYCFNNNKFFEILDWVKLSLDEINSKLVNIIKPKPIPGITNWNSELAETWHNVKPPLRPSKSEIKVYRKYLREISQNSEYLDCNALILGTTNEFRILFAEEGFNVTIVDISKDYHNEISQMENVINLDNENVIHSNWLNILENSNIKENSFDVVIGDLSIGNIKPTDFEKFINQIQRLLKEDGLFLGKTIFSKNETTYKQNEIDELFFNYFKDKELQNSVNIYEYSIYQLAIFATNRKNKIIFPNMYNKALQMQNKHNFEYSILEPYLGETTSFRDRMKMDFYVYPIKEFLSKTLKYFYIDDIEYGDDYYSSNFPLLILKKGIEYTELNYRKFYHQLTSFLNDNEYLIEKWSASLTSQYFLANIISLLNYDYENFECDIGKIQKQINEHIRKGMNIALNNELNCKLDCYFDMNMINEVLIKKPELKNNKRLKSLISKHNLSLEEKKEINSILDEPLKNNYIYGMLCYLTWFNSNKKNEANDMVVELLFSSLGSKQIWEPKKSLWVSARICLSLFPMYELLSKENQDKLYKVFTSILYSYNDKTHKWDNYDLGNSDDTFALCLNALLCFKDIANKESEKPKLELKNLFDDIIETYLIGSNLFNTISTHYIGLSLILDSKKNIESCRKINNSLSFITSLIRLSVSYLEYEKIDKVKKQNLIKSKSYLLNIILSFWNKFKSEIIDIENYSKKYEYSLVPQILYSIVDAVSSDNILPKEDNND